MRKILTGLMCLMLTAACLTALAEENDPADAYEPVIKMYLAGLQGDEAVLESDEFNLACWMCSAYAEKDPLDAVGYGYADLDGDGQMELYIAETSGAGLLDGCVFDVWTLKADAPVLALRGWERNRMYFARMDGDGEGPVLFYNEGSDSAFDSYFSLGRLENGSVAWDQAIEYHEEEISPWTLNGEAIAENQAEALIEKWSEGAYLPPVAPFRSLTEGPDGEETRFFTVTEGGRKLSVTVSDTGRRNGPEAERPNILSVSVKSGDGQVEQTFEYDSSELPGRGLAMMEDMNGDGYGDLLLFTARGARNLYQLLYLWNEETLCFDPAQTACVFDPAAGKFADEVGPAELCLPEKVTVGEKVYVVCDEMDGYAEKTVRVYGWEGRQITLRAVFDVYRAGTDTIGDRAYLFASQAERLWDQSYPESWYYEGGTFACDCRRAAFDAAWKGEGKIKRVAHTDWVNLRRQDGKQSLSLAHLDAGTEVLVLRPDCADGWDLVLWHDPNEMDSDGFFGPKSYTGYIWHSFLE